jgi:hypothetical protein
MLVALLLAAAPDAGAPDAGTAALYSAATTEPHGLLQLELKAGGKGRFKQVVSIHLPPAEVEVLDVTVDDKGQDVCLTPKPKALDVACLAHKGDGLEATFKGKKLLLEKR